MSIINIIKNPITSNIRIFFRVENKQKFRINQKSEKKYVDMKWYAAGVAYAEWDETIDSMKKICVIGRS